MLKLIYVFVGFVVLMLVGFVLVQIFWDMLVVWFEGNFYIKNVQIFVQCVFEVIDGEVQIIVYFGGVFGIKGFEGMVVVCDGIVFIVDILMSQQVGENFVFGVEMLFFFVLIMQDLILLYKFYCLMIEKIVVEMNQKLLYMIFWLGQVVYLLQLINMLVDMLGLKICVVDVNGYDYFVVFGVLFVQMLWGEVVLLLVVGMINGVIILFLLGVDGVFWEFFKNMNMFNWQVLLNIVMVNLDEWVVFDFEDQVVIEVVVVDLEGQFWLNLCVEDVVKLVVLKEYGIIVIVFLDELKVELLEKVVLFWDVYKVCVLDVVLVIDVYLLVCD